MFIKKVKKIRQIYTRKYLISYKKMTNFLNSKKNQTNSVTSTKQRKTFKTTLLNKFLKYQFTICVKKTLPNNHLLPILLLTCIFHSLRYIILYGISIIFILTMIYLSEKYPNKIGLYYISFLKKHSNQEIFNKYCGNFWSVLKKKIKHPKFFKKAATNGIKKVIVCASIVLFTEHLINKAKFGQLYEYYIEKILNNGVHPSNKPLELKFNSYSILEKLIGK